MPLCPALSTFSRSERLLGDESGSEDEEDESSNRDRDVAELLRRMAKALADFYGLGEVHGSCTQRRRIASPCDSCPLFGRGFM